MSSDSSRTRWDSPALTPQALERQPIRLTFGACCVPSSSVPSTQHKPETDWQPATSEPGELFTVEGRIRAAGAFARGLQNRDPRLVAYRRSMRRVAAAVVALGAFFALVAALLF